MSDDNARAVVLIGPMGAGKSTVGRRLAQEMKVPFIDGDEDVEANVKMSIPDVFERFGERHFRALEAASVHRVLADGSRCVFATGGGAFAQESVRELCRYYDAVTVYLRTSPETSWSRVQDDDQRPLLQTEDPIERLRELLAKREPYYEEARITLETDTLSLEQIVDAIRDEF